MRPIPKKLLKDILSDPFYKICCLTGEFGVELHHVWIYSGKQINEKWAIVPLIPTMHRIGNKAVHNNKEQREKVELISLRRATKEDFKKYPKFNWEQRLNYLEKKYG